MLSVLALKSTKKKNEEKQKKRKAVKSKQKSLGKWGLWKRFEWMGKNDCNSVNRILIQYSFIFGRLLVHVLVRNVLAKLDDWISLASPNMPQANEPNGIPSKWCPFVYFAAFSRSFHLARSFIPISRKNFVIFAAIRNNMLIPECRSQVAHLQQTSWLVISRFRAKTNKNWMLAY